MTTGRTVAEIGAGVGLYILGTGGATEAAGFAHPETNGLAINFDTGGMDDMARAASPRWPNERALSIAAPASTPGPTQIGDAIPYAIRPATISRESLALTLAGRTKNLPMRLAKVV